MHIHARMLWVVIALAVSLFSMENCFAQAPHVFILFRTGNDLAAQQLIDNAFTHGLEPGQHGTGQNTDDFFNFLTRPDTHPFFFVGFRDLDRLLTANQGTTGVNVIFEVRADDNNFWAMGQIFDALHQEFAQNPAVDSDLFAEFLETIARDYGFPPNNRFNSLVMLTGFDQNTTREDPAIPATAIEQATIYVNGRPRAPQINNGFAQNGLNMFPAVPEFAAPTQQIPGLVDIVQVQQNHGWRTTLLSAFSCGRNQSSSQKDQQQAISVTGTCRYPVSSSIKDAVALLRRELAWRYNQVLFPEGGSNPK